MEGEEVKLTPHQIELLKGLYTYGNWTPENNWTTQKTRDAQKSFARLLDKKLVMKAVSGKAIKYFLTINWEEQYYNITNEYPDFVESQPQEKIYKGLTVAELQTTLQNGERCTMWNVWGATIVVGPYHILDVDIAKLNNEIYIIDEDRIETLEAYSSGMEWDTDQYFYSEEDARFYLDWVNSKDQQKNNSVEKLTRKISRLNEKLNKLNTRLERLKNAG